MQGARGLQCLDAEEAWPPLGSGRPTKRALANRYSPLEKARTVLQDSGLVHWVHHERDSYHQEASFLRKTSLLLQTSLGEWSDLHLKASLHLQASLCASKGFVRKTSLLRERHTCHLLCFSLLLEIKFGALGARSFQQPQRRK